MQVEANRISADAQNDQEAKRVSERVNEVTAALQTLQLAINAVKRLRTAIGEQRVSLSGLDDGRAALAAHAARGWPSNQAFTAARHKIVGVTSRVNTELAQEWERWTTQRLDELQVVRIPLLEQDDEKAARQRRESLFKLAKNPVPRGADIDQFALEFGLLKDMLDEVASLSEELLSLLQRLGERPSLTLAALTDDQIALLRQEGIAGQIEVRRRGA
jgi:hypothetical protein